MTLMNEVHVVACNEVFLHCSIATFTSETPLLACMTLGRRLKSVFLQLNIRRPAFRTICLIIISSVDSQTSCNTMNLGLDWFPLPMLVIQPWLCPVPLCHYTCAAVQSGVLCKCTPHSFRCFVRGLLPFGPDVKRANSVSAITDSTTHAHTVGQEREGSFEVTGD